MKILRMVYDWPEPWDGLGPGPYFLSRSQGLLGHKVTVLVGNLNKKNLLKFRFFEYPEKNVKVINLPRALTSHSGPFLTTAPCVLLEYLYSRILNRVEIVHGHGHITLFFSLYKLFFGWLDKVPYVIHFHNCSKARTLNANLKGEKFSFLQKYLENPLDELSDYLALRTCNKAISVSDTNLEDFKKYYARYSNKLILVENGAPTHLFKPISNIDHNLNYKTANGDIRILCVGVLSERKGAHKLIESLKYLPKNYKLTWVGTFSSKEYKNKINKLLNELNLENRVNLVGYVTNLEIPKYFQESSLFVLPSAYEAFPKVVLEALACGVVCLVHGFKSSNKIQGLNYLSSLDPKIISTEILNLVKENQKVDVEFIHEKYSWDAKAKEIDQIYNSIG